VIADVTILDTAPPARRSLSVAMYALCALGVAVALVLTVIEAANGQPVRVTDVTDDKVGRVVSIEANVTNHTDVERCPDVRAAARDAESRDLAEVTARPINGDSRIAPNETVRYRAVIDSLTREERAEKLDELTMFVYEPHRCEP